MLHASEADNVRMTSNAANTTNNGNDNANAPTPNTAVTATVPEIVPASNNNNNNNNNNAATSVRAATFGVDSRGARGGAINPADAAAVSENLTAAMRAGDMNNSANNAALLRLGILGTTRFGRNLIPPVAGGNSSLFDSLINVSDTATPNTTTGANNATDAPANTTDGDALGNNNNNNNNDNNNNNVSEREERRVRRRMS